jgi:hypothetical protein
MEKYQYTLLLVGIVLIILIIDAVRDVIKQVNKSK